MKNDLIYIPKTDQEWAMLVHFTLILEDLSRQMGIFIEQTQNLIKMLNNKDKTITKKLSQYK